MWIPKREHGDESRLYTVYCFQKRNAATKLIVSEPQMNQNRITLLFAALCAIGVTGCVGCAGTSPQFNTPQMNTPTLPQRNVAANTARGSSNSTAEKPDPDEAGLPPLDKADTPKGLFIAKPYVQQGPTADGKEISLTLLWITPEKIEIKSTNNFRTASRTPGTGKMGRVSPNSKAAPKPAETKPTETKPAETKESTPDTGTNWTVEMRAAGKPEWEKIKDAPTVRRLAAPGRAQERLYRVTLAEQPAGTAFDYRVMRGEDIVFAGRSKMPKAAGQPVRFAVFGDCGAGTAGQKKVAYQTSVAKPDFVFITGDIVYDHGLAQEYHQRFFPIYNADTATEKTGAPLMRSVPFYASAGNHDTAYTDLSKYPDGLAYYYYFDLPRNGPALTAKGKNTPPVRGSDAAEKALVTASGDAYPRMANYSFDYGNTHWLVLDSNYYVDWSLPELREYVEKDLSSTKAPWKFVAFHIPPFHSSKQHQEDQYMRVLCDIFEKYSVDIVWSGHVHNYQRTYPMKFQATRGASGNWRDNEGRVTGKWTLDKVFDGEKNMKPGGPIYIVSGAGGGPIYGADLTTKKEAWAEFTAKYVGAYSFTLVETEAGKLTVRQVSETGKDLDRFMITK